MRRTSLIVLFSLLAAGCGAATSQDLVTVASESTAPDSETIPDSDPESPTTSTGPATDRPAAREFPEGLEWLNTERPLALSQLSGKIVLLDFWTYGCINCIHVIPDLKRIEEEYSNEVVVIGVHSAKFEQESSTENIRQIILRYGVEHPVVNDHEFEVWRSFQVNAWPTLYAIDPGGGVVGYHSGEGVYEVIQPVIEGLLAEFEGSIDRTPLAIKLEAEGLPQTVLSFPGKVTADESGRLFISDTNHNRIVQTSLEGRVEAVFGTGEAAYVDGAAEVAALNQPQGTALSADGSTLYVADTENHVVRGIDLATGRIETVAGTGHKGWPPLTGEALSTSLNSPWGLELGGDQLYIAMAGTHQIWSLDLSTGIVGPFAGSGREGTVNGLGAEAELAQPSGVSLADDGRLFFADSESSAIRWVDTNTSDRLVGISAGSEVDLFSFGDQDGIGNQSLLQHPLGVVAVGEIVYLADTYNSKVKAIDLVSGAVTTLWGDTGGWRDGTDPLFYEPGGIDALGDLLYVADTNNHSVRVIDLRTGQTSTLVLIGIEAFMPSAESDQYRGTIVELAPVTVGAGPGELIVDIALPDGYKVNPEAPSSFAWSVAGGVAVLAPDASGTRINPSFPLPLGATFSEGSGVITGDISIVYCDVDAESICLIEQVRITIPLEVVASGGQTLTITHEVLLPEL